MTKSRDQKETSPVQQARAAASADGVIGESRLFGRSLMVLVGEYGFEPKRRARVT